MRIIAGEFKGRRLKSVPGMATRPTPDRLRESLFSILQPELPGSRFADLFAGTGAVGLEALSRGAAEVIFVEASAKAAEVLAQNVASVQATNRGRILRKPVARALRSVQADIVFVDPPYEDDSAYQQTLEALAETDASLLLVQHAPKKELPDACGPFARVRIVRQGDNAVSFYRKLTVRDPEATETELNQPSPSNQPAPSPGDHPPSPSDKS